MTDLIANLELKPPSELLDEISRLRKALEDLVNAARNEAIDTRVMRQATDALQPSLADNSEEKP